MGNPCSLYSHHIIKPGTSRGLPQEHVATREGKFGHVFLALSAAGAAQVTAHEFRLMDKNGDLERPKGAGEFTVRSLLRARRKNSATITGAWA